MMNIKQNYKKAILEFEDNEAIEATLSKLNIPIHKTKTEPIPHYRDGKKVLKITEKKGEKMDTCATISHDYICCNVKVIKSVSNCPYDCSYCFLQNYLNDGTTQVVGDTKSLMDEVKANINKEPWRQFRIGTWELGDSLALETLTHQAKQLILEFAKEKNAILELKTKSAEVDSILELDHKLNTVVSWSLNTSYIIDKQEHRTASLSERLIGIKKVADSGYLVGLHFDPMIYYPDWKNDYTSLILNLFKHVKPEQIAWISVGSLRFNPEMKKKMEENFPAQDLTTKEMVLGPDGKMRYVKPLRLEMYEHIYSLLCNACKKSDLDPMLEPDLSKPLFYFCMERWDVWDTIIGSHPESVEHLDYLFALNLKERFNLGPTPELSQYLKINDQTR
jgi:spore photoproduct lyase